jgi:hypothetical protein
VLPAANADEFKMGSGTVAEDKPVAGLHCQVAGSIAEGLLELKARDAPLQSNALLGETFTIGLGRTKALAVKVREQLFWSATVRLSG